MVAALSAICGSILRRKSTDKIGGRKDASDPPPQPSPVMTPSSSPPQPTWEVESCSNVNAKAGADTDDEQQGQGLLLLPLPPAMQSRHSPSCSFSNVNHLPRSSSVNKLKSSLSSTAFLRSMSMRKGGNMNDDETEGVGRNNGLNGWSKLKKKQDKLKREDSIWTKTIILGEKCRVPDDDEGVYYDNKGNKISSFRPRTTRSVTLSRSELFTDSSSSTT